MFGVCFGSGSLTTIAAARTRAWGQAFPIRRTTASHHAPVAIGFVMVIGWSRRQSSADCTTSIVSSRWLHDPAGARREFLRSTGVRTAWTL
jgi:hypothetical protein